MWRSALEGEEGELGVMLTPEAVVKVAPPSATSEQVKQQEEYEPITIAIEYEVVKPGAGIAVVGPDEANPSVRAEMRHHAWLRAPAYCLSYSDSLTSSPPR